MTRSIPHRELRNNSSAILREVQHGERIEISNHGEVVAVLVPPPRPATDGLRTRHARIRQSFSELPRIRVDEPVQDALEDLRGDR